YERGLCCFVEFGRRWWCGSERERQLPERTLPGPLASKCTSAAPRLRRSFEFEESERLPEIVSVRRKAASGRDVHINEAELARSIFSSEEDRKIYHLHTDVANILAGVRSRGGEFSAEVVGRKSRGRPGRNDLLIGHSVPPRWALPQLRTYYSSLRGRVDTRMFA
ncbi:MAG: hypothetical protein JWO80_2273, partial [Bryobacterales bacterium]|nr:hypothetical protein [Bryobacterales bacterium]